MLFETRSGGRRHGLMVTSRYKAGIPLVHLPPEIESEDGGVSRNLIISNWEAGIYPDLHVTHVEFIGGTKRREPSRAHAATQASTGRHK